MDQKKRQKLSGSQYRHNKKRKIVENKKQGSVLKNYFQKHQQQQTNSVGE